MTGDRAQIRFCLVVAALGLGLVAGLARAGEPLRVPVEGGRADFRVRCVGDGPILVVASAMARAGGPFAVSLRAEPADREDPLPAWTLPRFHPEEPSFEIDTGIRSDSSSEASRTPPGGSREFWLPVRPGVPADATRYVPIQARRIQVGRYIQIYVDVRDLDRVDPALPAFLVAAFDDEILPGSASRWGTARDVDGDGRFTVLLTSWLGHLERRGAPVEGCFRGADLDLAVAPPFGNRCDMVSLDARLPVGSHAKIVLTHEYAHAVLFSRRVLGESGVARAAEDEEGWLDEAMAHLVEDDHAPARWNSNLDRRLAAYQAAPEAFRLVLPENLGEAAFAEGGGNRGAATLFLRWCARGTSDRDDLLRRLARPGARGEANLERATGVPFPELFRGWTVSQFLEPEATGSVRPAAATVAAGGPACVWRAQPTSARYVIVTPAEGSACVRVRLDAPAEAELQVTAIPLGADVPARLGIMGKRQICW